MINRFPAYRRLADMAAWLTQHPDATEYMSNQFFADLLVWYHLAWLGESVRRQDARVKRLLDKESGYTLHDRRELLSVIGELLSGLISRYARLAERGQVELSVSPYAHPILPLLLDFQSAHDAMPARRCRCCRSTRAASSAPVGISARVSRRSAGTSVSHRPAAGRRRGR